MIGRWFITNLACVVWLITLGLMASFYDAPVYRTVTIVSNRWGVLINVYQTRLNIIGFVASNGDRIERFTDFGPGRLEVKTPFHYRTMSYSAHFYPVMSREMGFYCGVPVVLASAGSSFQLQLPLWPFQLLSSLLVIAMLAPVLKKRARRRNNACPTCNYDLRGSVESAVCPECGTPITPERRERLRAAAVTTEAAITTEAGGGILKVDKHDDTR